MKPRPYKHSKNIPAWQLPFFIVWGLLRLAWDYLTGKPWNGENP